MVRRALIVVECDPMGICVRYVQAAHRLGLHPIVLTAEPERYPYLTAERIDTIRVDTSNIEKLIHECSDICASYGIAGIACSREAYYATVGTLCQYFDLPGPNPISIAKCCDKFTQRQLLAQADVPIPAYRLAENAADVERSAAEIGVPVILKPSCGSGSSGVRLCRTVEELVEHTGSLLGDTQLWRTSPRLLVERYAEGPHYTVHTMGNEVVGIGTASFGRPPHFVYDLFTFPASLTDDEYERLANIALSCLRALDLGWGPTNIEIRWTKQGPLVIEVNPRLAGVPDPHLIQAAWGIDLTAETIKLIIGEECNLRRRHSRTAAARFMVPDRDGTLEWISGVSRAAAEPGVAEVKLFVEATTPIVKKDYRDCIGL